MKKDTIEIHVPDWVEEHSQLEADVSTEDKIIDLMIATKMSAAKAARVAIIAREKKQAPEDIVPANKLLLNTGGAMAIQQAVARRTRKVQLENGNTVNVRELVAPVADNPTNVGGIVDTQDPQALQRALDYLLKIVPGYVNNRLEIIAINGGDVVQAANEFKQKVDEMVSRLV